MISASRPLSPSSILSDSDRNAIPTPSPFHLNSLCSILHTHHTVTLCDTTTAARSTFSVTAKWETIYFRASLRAKSRAYRLGHCKDTVRSMNSLAEYRARHRHLHEHLLLIIIFIYFLSIVDVWWGLETGYYHMVAVGLMDASCTTVLQDLLPLGQVILAGLC